jgi:hypothetical protein
VRNARRRHHPYGQSKHRTDSFYSLDRAANQFCLFDSGALQNSYALERVSAWCRERFPRKIGDTASGRVCSPVASTCTASTTTISSISVDVFDDVVNKSMLLDSFQSNIGYDVILTIETLVKHKLLWTTFHHRIITQSEPATPLDLLAAHISTAEAY